MHISEGVLSTPVLIAGAALTLTSTAIGLKRVDYDRLPLVAVLSAAFFVGSLIHVPIGPSNVHLILNGLMGIFLGWAAFPAILVGLILQAILFQYGGLTSLGVNTMIMATPAVICYYTLRSAIRSERSAISMIASFLCGFGAVFLGSLLLALSLVFTGESFLPIAKLAVVAHLPVMVLEGFITTFCLKFVKQVKPDLLEAIKAA